MDNNQNNNETSFGVKVVTTIFSILLGILVFLFL